MSLWSELKVRLKAGLSPDLRFESKWAVTVTDAQITCKRPSGVIESIDWDDLEIVVIETNDEGPFAPDVFWYLAGGKSGCVVPIGVSGEEELVKRLQSLPDFNNEAFADAMSSTSNKRFVCWRRDHVT